MILPRVHKSTRPTVDSILVLPSAAGAHASTTSLPVVCWSKRDIGCAGPVDAFKLVRLTALGKYSIYICWMGAYTLGMWGAMRSLEHTSYPLYS